jgi:DNA-binding Xre family transcriptional regulator
MTKLGEFLTSKSINKAEIARKTGISNTRLSELTRKESAKLKVEELYLIALAIEIAPNEILEKICGHLKLIK